jgi:hypothetical protein
MAISIVALPLANAQEPREQRTYPFIDATPNPVGVGEQCLIRIGISQLLGLVDQGWEGLMVEMTDPDEHTTTLGPYRTDSTGGTAFVHVFDEVGTYQIRLHFPEQEVQVAFFDYERGFVSFPVGTVMLESYTPWLDVVVTEEANPSYPDQPLPAEYWTRPIDPQLRMWCFIAGNWRERGVNSIAEYNDDAPETAHVLWTTEITTGGLTGGLWYPEIPASSETGDAYEGKFPGAIVLNGILYWQTGGSRGDPGEITYTVATDLHTGEELWRTNEHSFSFGQILYFNSYNYDGVFSYLVQTGSVADDRTTEDVDESYDWWNFTDPWTGNDLFTWTNLPSGTRFFGPSGEILILEINYANRWMALWNSTATGFARLGAASPDYGSWGNTVHGRTQNITELGSECYSWNVTLDRTYQTSTTFGTPAMGIYLDEEVITGLWYNQSGCRLWSVDFDGDERFYKWWDAPAEWETGFNTLHVGGRSDFYEGGFVFVWNKENRQHYAFSVEDGDYMWVSESEHYLDWYGWGAAEHTWFVYEDHLFSTGVGGIVYAINIADGTTDWTYELADAFNEPVTGQRWWGWITLIADGKVYVGTCEHSAEQPLPRGAPLVCLNASNGAEIWRVNGMYRATRWGGNAVMGDSIYATMDTYDQRVYAVGKGPSATTAVIENDVITEGDMALIKGMVTDISPGTEEYGLTARFPNGVPAVCDDNMSDWMLYVYKQFAKPADVVGVDVTVTVLDPNGNSYEVGTVTSDENGFYQLMFEPPVSGEYTVYATFCGSEAYWGSSTTTALGVLAAPEPTAPPTEPPADPTGTYVTGFGIGIIVVVVVIGLVIILMLRKR